MTVSKKKHIARLFVTGIVWLASLSQTTTAGSNRIDLKSRFLIAWEIAQFETSHSAAIRQFDSRLVEGTERLTKLRELHGRGRATWMEFARQQVYVEQLRAQKDAAIQWGSFLEQLRDAYKGGRTSDLFESVRDTRVHLGPLGLSQGHERMLRKVSREIVALQANATGRIRAASADLARRQLRLQAVQQLFGHRHATPAELHAAQKDVAAASTRVKATQRQREYWTKRLEAAEAIDRVDDTTLVVGSSAGERFEGQRAAAGFNRLGDETLASSEAVGQWIELRRHRVSMEVERRLALAELQFDQERLRRLKLSSDSVFRSRREQEYVRLDRDFHQAFVDMAIERLDRLRLEESLLVLQQYVDRHDRVRSGELVTVDSVPRLFAQLTRSALAQATRWSSTLPAALLSNSAGMLGHAVLTGVVQAAEDCRGRLPMHRRLNEGAIPTGSTTVAIPREPSPTAGTRSFGSGFLTRRDRSTIRLGARRRAPSRASFGWSEGSRITPSTSGSARRLSLSFLSNSWSTRVPNRVISGALPRRSFSTPSYNDGYVAGIRRADFSPYATRFGRATAYGGPWYFPGAPTNFR